MAVETARAEKTTGGDKSRRRKRRHGTLAENRGGGHGSRRLRRCKVVFLCPKNDRVTRVRVGNLKIAAGVSLTMDLSQALSMDVSLDAPSSSDDIIAYLDFGTSRVEWKTSKSLLSAQSSYFGAVLQAVTPTETRVVLEETPSFATRIILDLVALPKGTKVEQVLTYPFTDAWFDDSKAVQEYQTVWKTMHKWQLWVMIERFKQEIHRRLFKNRCISASTLICMENAVNPNPDDHFFRQCAAIIIARKLFIRPYSNENPHLDSKWDESTSAVWIKYGNEIRKQVMDIPCYGVERDSPQLWQRTFPLKLPRAQCESVQLQKSTSS